MTDRKFYKNTIKVEVLSHEPIPDTLGLEEICHEATDGAYTFKWVREPEQELTGEQAASELINTLDTDPSFFGLDDKGNDVG